MKVLNYLLKDLMKFLDNRKNYQIKITRLFNNNKN